MLVCGIALGVVMTIGPGGLALVGWVSEFGSWVPSKRSLQELVFETYKSEYRVPLSEFANLDTSESPEQLARRFPVFESQTHSDGDRVANVLLSGGEFEDATILWKAGEDYTSSISLRAPEGLADPGAMRDRLAGYLGARLRGKDNGNSEALLPGRAGISLAKDGRWFAFSSTSDDELGVDAKAKAAALWALMINVAIGRPPPLEEKYRTLVNGHSLRAIAQLDPDIEAQAVVRFVQGNLPGSEVRLNAVDLRVRIASSHRWFDELSLAWGNRQGAMLQRASLTPFGDTWEDREAVGRCLDGLLGKRDVQVEGDLQGTEHWHWRDAAGKELVALRNHALELNLRGTPANRRKLPTILEGLHGCVE